jgi:putative ABC transport system ATP-binding protein
LKEKNMSLVKIEGLSKAYKQDSITVDALKDINLSIEKGEFIALAGPSGSGKTTLLNIIGALDKPTAGRVYLGDDDITKMSKNELSQIRLNKIGFIFQEYNLIPVLTALENVEYVMLLQGLSEQERREKAYGILKEVGLEGLEDRRPSQLSGGQQQRVAVARAIVSHPSLILADEPTANLDSKTADSLLDLMYALNQEKGITFVFSTHDKLVMEHARRLILLKDGKVSGDERK